MADLADGLSPGSPAVRILGLSRAFGSVTAVHPLTFDIASGEIFGLIGPNGAGKSTLLKMLATLLPPSGGTALIAGCDLRRAPAQVREKIGYVPQKPSADGGLTGYENLLLSARLYGVPRAERDARIERALDHLGLSAVAHRLVGHYSGGMARRLEIAQNLLHRPYVLFLDEPTAGLDPAARDAVWKQVLELRDRHGRTIVVTSHHLEEIDEFCSRVALIHKGRVARMGAPRALKAGLRPGATLDDVFIDIVGSGDAVSGDGA